MDQLQNQLIEAYKMVLSGNQASLAKGQEFIDQNKMTPKFCSCLMVLIDKEDLDLNIRQFAITTFKGLVEKKWRTTEQNVGISEEDKNEIKSNILEAIIRVAGTRKLYKTYEKIFYLIASQDFPKNWENIINQIVAKLQQDDFNCLFGGLIALKNIVQVFEYQIGDNDRAPLEDIVNTTFPILIQLASKIWANFNENTAVLIQKILKIFYISVNLELPVYFSDFSKLTDWLNLFTLLYQYEMDQKYRVMPATEQEIIQLGKVIFWKNKKSVSKILMRFVQKYSNDKLEGKNSKGLSSHFKQTYGQPLIDMFLRTLNTSLEEFISLPTLHFSMRYIQMSLRVKEFVEYLTPNLTNLAVKICVPLTALTQRDINLFQNDPIEFMRKEEDFSQTMFNPKNGAMDLIETIAKLNNSRHLIEITQFYLQTLQSGQIFGHPLSLQQRDGIIWAFGELYSQIIANEQLKSQVEQLLEHYVLPLFQNSAPYIRARVCWVYGIYGGLQFKNQETVKQVTQFLCQSIQDKNLIIRTKAGVALNKFLQQKISKDIIRSEIKSIVEIFLKLMEEVDNEDLVHALEGIIGNFGEEIKDFSIGLVYSLIEAFYRYDEKEEENDEMYGEGEFAAAGCLNAINKILSQNLQPSIYPELEKMLTPVIHFTLGEESDYIEEGLDMLALIIKKTPQISEELYFFFVALSYLVIGLPDELNIEQITVLSEKQQLTLQSVRSGWGVEFTSKLLPCFKNFIQRDINTFLKAQDFFQRSFVQLMFMTIQAVIETGIKSEDEIDMSNILHYLLAFVENNFSNNAIREVVVKIIQMTVQSLKSVNFKMYKKQAYVVLCTCMIYDVNLVIEQLEQLQCTQQLFATMLETIINNKKPKNNDDLEVQKMLMGLTNILTIPQDKVPQSILSVFKLIMEGLVFLSTMTLELRESYSDDDDDEDEDIDTDFFDKAEYNDKYDSPMDEVDELVNLQEKINQLKQSNPNMFGELIKLLSEEQQKKLDSNLQEGQKQYQEYLQNQSH